MYKTTDIYVTATLIALGYRLIGVDKSEKRAVFSFEDTPELKLSVSAYKDNLLRLNPRDVMWGLKRCKNELYGDEKE